MIRTEAEQPGNVAPVRRPDGHRDVFALAKKEAGRIQLHRQVLRKDRGGDGDVLPVDPTLG